MVAKDERSVSEAHERGSLAAVNSRCSRLGPVTAGERAFTHSGHGWLPAVIPAQATRFRVDDPELAAILAQGGAELVDRGEEVEIASSDELRGRADVAVASLGGTVPDVERALPVRVAARLGRFTAVRREARHASARMRSLGYAEVRVLPWDVGHVLRLPGLGTARRRPVELLPQRALVIGRRPGSGATLLEDGLSNAGVAVADRLRPTFASVRQGVLVVGTSGGIFRIAVGPGRRQISEQLSALDALRSQRPPGIVADRIPWPLARAEPGLGVWSLERRLPGQRPRPELSERVLADCVDFLVALHGVGGSGEELLADQAETVASVCAPEEAGIARELGRRLQALVGHLHHGFGHGDFFRGNLLVESGRLVGVVDWDAAGRGRLPLVDLLHLHHMSDQRPADEEWGRLLVARLLPWAESGSPTIRDYCLRVGIDAAAVVRPLVYAYWMAHASYQLRAHPHRRLQPAWLAGNIMHVLRAAENDVPA